MFRTQRSDEILKRRKPIEDSYQSLNALMRQCEELTNKGSPVDIARTQPSLLAQARGLLRHPGMRQLMKGGEARGGGEGRSCKSGLKVTFTPSIVLAGGGAGNVVGELEVVLESLGESWLVGPLSYSREFLMSRRYVSKERPNLPPLDCVIGQVMTQPATPRLCHWTGNDPTCHPSIVSLDR